MDNSYFSEGTDIGFSESSETSASNSVETSSETGEVTESTFTEGTDGVSDNSAEDLDGYMGEYGSDNVGEGDDDSWEDLDKYLGEYESDKVDEGDDDSWDDLDKYLGKNRSDKVGESDGNDGENLSDNVGESNGDDVEDLDKYLNDAGKDTDHQQTQTEEGITENVDGTDVAKKQAISRSADENLIAKPENSMENPAEIPDRSAEASEQPVDMQEKPEDLPKEPAETEEKPEVLPKESAEMQENPEDPVKVGENTEMSGERAYALSFESVSSAEKLNSRFEEAYSAWENYSKEEMSSIQADSIRLKNEIEVEKASLETAIQSKHDEIYEFVTEGNMNNQEIAEDPRYQSMIEEYRAYQTQQKQLEYFSDKLEDNNSRLFEITGISGVEDIREAYENHTLKDTNEKIASSDRNNGELEWQGERGNSMRVPKDPAGELAAELHKYGVEGIEYRQGNVDFDPVALYEIDFSDQNEIYNSIGKNIEIGKLNTREDLNTAVRKTWQSIAKQQVVERIAEDKDYAAEIQKKTGIDISKAVSETAFKRELSRVGLTMHETHDCSRIQLVPTKIHDAFKHSGGTAEMLERQLSADVRRQAEADWNK